MGTTPLAGIPFPDGNDPVDGPGAFEAGFEAVETKLVLPFATTTARDNAITSPVDGQCAYIASGDAAEGPVFRNSDDAWRMAWNMPWGFIAYAERTSNQGSITTIADITSVTVTWTAVARRYYRVTGHALLQSTVADDLVRLSITTGANVLVQLAQMTPRLVNQPATAHATARILPGAGSVTYKLRAERVSGTGTITIAADATFPTHIMVEDIGPSGAPD